MEITNSINKAFRNLSRQYPANLFIQVLNEYKEKRGYKDYYETLDSFGFTIGIEYQLHEVYNKNDKLQGFQPILKYSPWNPLGKDAGFSELSNPMPLTKAAAYLAKEYMYRLQGKANLWDLAFS